MDDTHLVNWMVTWHPERALTDEEIELNVQGKGAHVCDYAPATSEPYGDMRTAANRDNDYWMDWEVHRTRMFCGIPGFGVQDQAIQESQGDIVDRTRERLGTSDTAIIQVRRRLMTAARALRDQGTPAPGGRPALIPRAVGLRRAEAGRELGRRGHGAHGGDAGHPPDPRLKRPRMAGRAALTTGGGISAATVRRVTRSRSGRPRARRTGGGRGGAE